MSLRGRVMAMGHYTFEDIRSWTSEQLHFAYHYQQLDRMAFLDQIATILGVRWDLNAMRSSQSGGGVGNEVFIPLAATVNPKLLEEIQKMAGKASPSPNSKFETNENLGEVKSTSSLSKEEFLALLGRKPKV